MNSRPINFTPELERLRELSRQRRSDGRPGGEVTGAAWSNGGEAAFELHRDDQGREVAVRGAGREEIMDRAWSRMMAANGLPAALPHSSSFSEDQQTFTAALLRGGKNAVLHGPAGTGKTAVALTALRRLHMAGSIVAATRFLRLKKKFEPAWREHSGESELTLLDRCALPQYLLLDEVGYGSGERTAVTEHERRVLFDLISEREAAGRFTWITTNYPIEQLEAHYGESTTSRLMRRGGCVKAKFTEEPNYRYSTSQPQQPDE